MSRPFYDPTWRGLAKGVATGVGGVLIGGAKLVGKGLGGYGKTIANTNWHSGWGRLRGAAMIGVPAIGAASLATHFDRPSPGQAQTYGDFIAQNNAFGNLPTEQMSGYDADAAMASARRNGMIKQNDYRGYGDEMTKEAFVAAIANALRVAAPFVATKVLPRLGGAFRSVVSKMPNYVQNAAPVFKQTAKNYGNNLAVVGNKIPDIGRNIAEKSKGFRSFVHEKTLGPGGALTPMSAGMTMGGVGMMSYGEASAARKTMQQNIANQTDIRNTTPIL